MNNRDLNEIYLFHLEKAYKQFKKHKTDRFKKAGIDITSDQWVLLKCINEQEGTSQRELAERSFKEPASVTRILDILERKGWVERRTVSGNRRAYELYTTKKGKALIKKVLPLAIELRAKGVKGLSAKEITHLKRMLVKVFENFN